MNNKRKPAEYLLDEIGLVDDALIYAAENLYPVRKSKKILIRSAAALAAVLTLFVGVKLMGKLTAKNSGDKAGSHAPSISIEEALNTVRSNPGSGVTTSDTVDLFGGKPKLIWQFAGEESYSHVDISTSERDRLTGAIIGASPAQYGSELSCRVWISYGNGIVISPHLRQSPGNIGYGSLFDYSPELEPSGDILRIILGLLHS